jgi:hypothetical protein
MEDGSSKEHKQDEKGDLAIKHDQQDKDKPLERHKLVDKRLLAAFRCDFQRDASAQHSSAQLSSAQLSTAADGGAQQQYATCLQGLAGWRAGKNQVHPHNPKTLPAPGFGSPRVFDSSSRAA